jgi:O-antigen/teichoic acid export membrane protein
VAIVFCVTFLLIYQALFQHKHNNAKNLFWALAIAIAQSALAYAVFTFWGYEYFTAATFLAAFYNMFWGVFHHSLEGTLSRRVFWETLIVSIFIAILAVSVTNFRAQILPECF